MLRDFLRGTYPSILVPGCTILDVAGGRGDLSWILRNIDGVDSIIADPRIPNHRRLVKSVEFLLAHPEEAAVRSVEGLPTHQPLAKLLPRLFETNGMNANDANDGIRSSSNQPVNLHSPHFMRMHVDNTLVETLRRIGSKPSDETDLDVWDEYWTKEQCRIESNKVHYGGTAPKTQTTKMIDRESSQISDAQSALDVFRSLDIIVGFHP